VRFQRTMLIPDPMQACDICSKRKVKCDDSGPPCKPCRDLGAECTYEKPSKRRGPPNKHAEGNKRVQFGPPDMLGHDQPSSPTHAAETLASFSLQQVLSAEVICPTPIVMHLVDDYFNYIHPLIPIPHENSFRSALTAGEATRNTTFLALLASMLGCVAAIYPQKPMQHFQATQIDNHAFPNSMALVDRCHKVITESQGPGRVDRLLSIHDAQVSYLQGLTCAYTFNPQSSIRYFTECMSILEHIGAHKASTYKYKGPALGAPQARMTPNGETLQGPQPGQPDLVIEEVTKRTFWAIFVTARSLQQSDVSPCSLTIPSATKSEPYPSLPLEVDDHFLSPDKAHAMPPGFVPAMAGFNTAVRIFLAYKNLAEIEASIEHLNGVSNLDRAANFDSQKERLGDLLVMVKGTSLYEVKQIQQDLPPDLSLNLQGTLPPSHNQTFPTLVPRLGLDIGPFNYNNPEERKRIQVELQKVNLNHSIISTRHYLER